MNEGRKGKNGNKSMPFFSPLAIVSFTFFISSLAAGTSRTPGGKRLCGVGEEMDEDDDDDDEKKKKKKKVEREMNQR